MNTKIASLVLVLSVALFGCQSTQQVVEEPAPEPQVMKPKPKPAPKPAPQVAKPAEPKPVDPNSYEELLKIRTLFFDFDRSDLRPEDQKVVAAHARFLRENPGSKLRLEGHADERGSREYNIGLGERRAQTVRRNLALQGAGADQLSTISYGEEKPLDSGHTESSWQLNRRVELVYN
ncbi:MAG: peptidoglycan-associated lipoprotein Pal [Pseudomonadota bacterium]